MKVLVTGCDGNIGKLISKSLLFTNKNLLLLFNYKKNKKDYKNKIYRNLTKPLKIKSNVDTIIHCASKTPNSSTENLKKIYSTNLKITKSIIDFANKNRVKRIIFFSSIDVYGSTNKKIVTETDQPVKPNFYARSKVISERMFCKKKNKFKSICLRIPGFLNPNTKKNYPMITSLIGKIKKNKKIKIYNSKQKFNNILDIDELLTFLRFIQNKQVNSNIFNLSASKPIYFIDLINMIKKKLSSKSIIFEINDKKKSFVISVSKIDKVLNFKTSSTKKIMSRFLKNNLI